VDIEYIQNSVEKNSYFFSKHADDERKNDNLSIIEIEEAILNGTVLEDYQDDKRGESCLVVGFTNFGKPIHMVCGQSGDVLVFITVYIPTPPKFKNPYQRG
jgi:hypothetical protein